MLMWSRAIAFRRDPEAFLQRLPRSTSVPSAACMLSSRASPCLEVKGPHSGLCASKEILKLWLQNPHCESTLHAAKPSSSVWGLGRQTGKPASLGFILDLLYFVSSCLVHIWAPEPAPQRCVRARLPFHRHLQLFYPVLAV